MGKVHFGKIIFTFFADSVSVKSCGKTYNIPYSVDGKKVKFQEVVKFLKEGRK